MTARTLALEARLAEIMPLFTEARDALVAITEVGAKLHGVSLSLADRMDAVGTKDWRSALEAETGEPVACYADHRLTPEGTTEFYGYADNKLEPGTMLYAAPPPAVPPGWKLVPLEPTPEMWKAGLANMFRDVDAVWRAMLAEVPEATGSAVSQWIPVTERLPATGMLVIVRWPASKEDWTDDDRIGFDHISADYEDWNDHCESFDHYMAVGGSGAAGPDGVCTGPSQKAPYTHWMPLPEAPK